MEDENNSESSVEHQIVNLGQINDYSLSLPIYLYFVLCQILALTTVLPFIAEHTHTNAAHMRRTLFLLFVVLFTDQT